MIQSIVRKMTKEEKEDSLIEGCNLVMLVVYDSGFSASFPFPKHMKEKNYYKRLKFKLYQYARENRNAWEKELEKRKRNREKYKESKILDDDVNQSGLVD